MYCGEGTLHCSAFVNCACELILFSVVFCGFASLHKYICRVVTVESNKWRPVASGIFSDIDLYCLTGPLYFFQKVSRTHVLSRELYRL